MAKRGIWGHIVVDIGYLSLKSLKGMLPMLPMLPHMLPRLPQTAQILKALLLKEAHDNGLCELNDEILHNIDELGEL